FRRPRLERRLLGSAVGYFRLEDSLRLEFDALLALLRTATLAAVPSTRRCLGSCSAAPAFQFFASEMSNCPARENFRSLDLTPLPSLKLVAFHGRQKGNHCMRPENLCATILFRKDQ